ncbi:MULTISPECIES: CHAT domain-containing protein [unclassified Coleofasciculus]|uniref:CHAT domain-containing protein n=1 Tax=unclassified Coleofasciculus TaxID=2692782 RepID=UPI00187E89DA|nr:MULTISPECIES: CHAT domain-containing tetratricopeptide repeat protein [unclassified Coleofasciculus]MBE9127787.1 CHAT domain-containing protein [Coleofasciculus sp. LEGE 07081]MBE9148579.1 CHAT domain-containing protein [Coleofasciculus sp. LEGE 07092]
MRLQKTGLIALITFFVVISTPLLLAQTASFSTSLSTNIPRVEYQDIQPLPPQEVDAIVQSNSSVLTLDLDISDRLNKVQSLNNRGLALYQDNQLEEAEQTLGEGIRVWESLPPGLDENDADSLSILETEATTYRLLQKVLIAQNKSDAALEIAERSRARALLELLAARSPKVPNAALTITPPTIEQIQDIAKAHNSTLVEYSIIDEYSTELGQAQESELYIWVIQPTGEITFRKSDLKLLWRKETTTLAEYVGSIRQSLGTLLWGVDSFEGGEVRPFQQLYQVLIEPIADQLPTDPDAHVIFIPQQALLMIPFAPLQDESGKYLLEKHTILTAPAIIALDLTHQARQRIPESVEEWLVVGNPTPMPSEFSPLPQAEREAEAIAALVKTQAITGKVATKPTIVEQMLSSRVIHLATHGILNEKQGLDSGVAFAPTSTDNGWLTAKEILDLKLTAELVVLSACNTGRGRVTGDGFVGLSTSLILSGVSSAIVSLWSIPDSPTAFLMTEFYRLLQQNPDKAQALRQAMLATREKHPALRDWAAFTLIGES